jgi:hypothetical protein
VDRVCPTLAADVTGRLITELRSYGPSSLLAHITLKLLVLVVNSKLWIESLSLKTLTP